MDKCRRTMAEYNNTLTAALETELDDVEVNDWYRNHTKVEAENEEDAFTAKHAAETYEDPAGVIEKVETEWKTETSFVVRRK